MLIPVLLSGGTGSRLWPLSRELYPKQLLPLVTDRSLLQETAARVADRALFDAPIVICNEEHRFVIAEQMRALGIDDATVVLEPEGRNTAPAIAVAARMALDRAPDAVILVLPADHAIADRAALARAIQAGIGAAGQGRFVTFGVTPDAPATGYGYIKRGAPLSEGAFAVERFVEKPDRATAERLLADGGYSWNSGMFLFPAALLLEELAERQPAVVAAADAALAGARRDLDFVRLGADAFKRAPSISIDHAVMEHTARAAVVPAELGWTDVGAWDALWDIAEKDADGNVRKGDVLALDSRNNYLRSEDRLLAVVGVEDLVVVTTEDAVLVAPRTRAQEVKALVEALRRDGRAEGQSGRRVHRPWGYYDSVHSGDRWQVKRIAVKPGAKLSLQKHHHRAEHWVVVHGTALVTRDGEQTMVTENQSVYIPLGAVHRLENPGRMPLHLIEVQTGSYLGEDDIVRMEDTYGRS